MDTIAAAEGHILATLRAGLAGRVKTVDSVPGEWDIALLRAMLALAPFALVAFSAGAVASPGSTTAAVDAQWEVYVGTSHASGQLPRRVGDALQPGAYELLVRTVQLLHGHLVPDIGSLELTGVANFYTGEVERAGLAVYGATFRIPSMPLELVGDAPALDDFRTLAAQYDIPPHDSGAEHARWLDGDYSASQPDTRDDITLQTAP